MARQQGGQQPDNSMAVIWIMVFFFITGGLIWYFFHSAIVKFIFHFKAYEAHLIAYLYPPMEDYAKVLKSLDPAQISFTSLIKVSADVGQYIRYPVIVVVGLYAAYLFNSSVASKYSTKYNMKGLAKKEVSNWPQITPVLELDLVKQSVEEGPWAMSLNPQEFVKKYDLVSVEEVPSEGLEKLPPKVTVIKDKARQIFIEQLGKVWEGHEVLKPHSRALLATFAARLNRDREGAMNLIYQMARTSGSGQIDYTGADDLLKKHVNSDLAKQVISKHAYESTVMAAMLNAARDDGVFASADFLWLKPIDRPLWYLLNTIGRQTPFIEVAGPFAHWMAEKTFGAKIKAPMVETAVSGLEVALSEVIYKPDE